MLHAPFTITTAKLDISLLLKSSPSPPPSSAAPSSAHVKFARSISVPAVSSHEPLPVSSRQTSPGATSQPALSSTARQIYGQAQRPFLPPLNTQPPYPLAQPSPRIPKRPPPTASHPAASPAKKQSKWTPEEDALIIDLRGSGMKWEDISKRLPGRSAISCRLHYQNYLERRSEWDDEKKNRLARLYERLKPEMWGTLATELNVPWRAAEAMHWQLGEVEMARRAGVVPFSLTPAHAYTTNSGPGAAFPSPAGRGYGNDERAAFGNEPLGPTSRIRRGSGRGLDSTAIGGNVASNAPGQCQTLPSLAELERGMTAFHDGRESGASRRSSGLHADDGRGQSQQ